MLYYLPFQPSFPIPPISEKTDRKNWFANKSAKIVWDIWEYKKVVDTWDFPGSGKSSSNPATRNLAFVHRRVQLLGYSRGASTFGDRIAGFSIEDLAKILITHERNCS